MSPLQFEAGLAGISEPKLSLCCKVIERNTHRKKGGVAFVTRTLPHGSANPAFSAEEVSFETYMRASIALLRVVRWIVRRKNSYQDFLVSCTVICGYPKGFTIQVIPKFVCESVKLFSRAGVRGRRTKAHKVLLTQKRMRKVSMYKIDIHVFVVLLAAIAGNIVPPRFDEAGIHSSSLRQSAQFIWLVRHIIRTITWSQKSEQYCCDA